MRAVLRDDDTSFFTTPEDLEAVYGAHWDRAVVSFAVVPFIGRLDRPWVPERYRGEAGPFPIGDNAELVRYLRERVRSGRVDIVQHGYAHMDEDGGAEFAPPGGRAAARLAVARLEAGRRHLESVFGAPIRVFVPPHNRLSRAGWHAVGAAGLHLLGGQPARLRGFTPSVLATAWRRRRFCERALREGGPVQYYPFVLLYGGLGQLECTGLVPGVAARDVLARAAFVERNGGVFCLATHYWEVRAHPEIQKALDEVAAALAGRWVKAGPVFE